MTYGDFNGLTRRTASDKIFRNKSWMDNDGYEHGIVSMVYKFFD